MATQNALAFWHSLQVLDLPSTRDFQQDHKSDLGSGGGNGHARRRGGFSRSARMPRTDVEEEVLTSPRPLTRPARPGPGTLDRIWTFQTFGIGNFTDAGRVAFIGQFGDWSAFNQLVIFHHAIVAHAHVQVVVGRDRTWTGLVAPANLSVGVVIVMLVPRGVSIQIIPSNLGRKRGKARRAQRRAI